MATNFPDEAQLLRDGLFNPSPTFRFDLSVLVDFGHGRNVSDGVANPVLPKDGLLCRVKNHSV
ncbi:MAG: hypothetical protein CVV06_02405 [Gammaproteobacteria bacterium HGW-Gammaproteobacteria-10]|nr:MAG: hypothetical protein CVV06_02405 [Gammaproteobacteria bacterium HGW-Gammaproteobacteria-10]